MMLNLFDLNLLYVEDEKETRDAISELLGNLVKNVYIAKDGAEALEVFKSNNIHFVISDYQMPKLNGNQLCKKIKEINPSVYFVLLTAYNDTELLIGAIDSGIDKFLQKPIKSKSLFKVIDDVNQTIMQKFKLEKSMVCLQEAEEIAKLSYWDVNLESGVISFSKEAKALFGFEESSPGGYKDFLEVVDEEYKPIFFEIFQQSVFHEQAIDAVILIKTKDEKSKYIHVAAKRWESSACGIKHLTGLFQDISTHELQKQELLKASMSDPALGISNKKFLILKLEQLIKSSKRYGHQLGVIFFDIDDFKNLNNRYGHLVADDILLELSKLIKNDIRESDYFGRWGGDEFVIITGYSSQEATIAMAQKLLQRVKNHIWSHDVDLTISMGISFYELKYDAMSLIKRADMKMYEAKKGGKNICSF